MRDARIDARTHARTHKHTHSNHPPNNISLNDAACANQTRLLYLGDGLVGQDEEVDVMNVTREVHGVLFVKRARVRITCMHASSHARTHAHTHVHFDCGARDRCVRHVPGLEQGWKQLLFFCFSETSAAKGLSLGFFSRRRRKQLDALCT